jgi:hypothetical protein
MNVSRPGTRSPAALAVIAACLLSLLPAAGAAARAQPKPITGRLDRPGVTVVALALHGRVAQAPARPRFSLVPPGRVVTLHLRDRAGAYLGPVVVAGRLGRVVVGIRAGARLGRIDVRDGYGLVRRAPAPRVLDPALSARARRGAPLGAGSLGWVPGHVKGPPGPGRDRDRDGIPDKFDVDDDGDLVLDVREHGRRPPSPPAARVFAALPLGACPQAVCTGSLRVSFSDGDRADLALAIAILAAVLAATSLAWQLLSARRRHAGRIAVDVRLGLPIYQQGGGDWSIFVEVTNGGEHPVRWVAAALELTDGRRLYLMQQPPGGELPAVLQPHEARQTWTRCRELELGGLDLTEPVVGIAKLDTGELVRAKRVRLLSRAAAKHLRD